MNNTLRFKLTEFRVLFIGFMLLLLEEVNELQQKKMAIAEFFNT